MPLLSATSAPRSSRRPPLREVALGVLQCRCAREGLDRFGHGLARAVPAAIVAEAPLHTSVPDPVDLDVDLRVVEALEDATDQRRRHLGHRAFAATVLTSTSGWFSATASIRTAPHSAQTAGNCRVFGDRR